MAKYRARFPFSFVLMAGDNIYEGPASAEDYRLKFEEPGSGSIRCSIWEDSGTTRFAPRRA